MVKEKHNMNGANTMKRAKKAWVITAKCLGILAIICTVAIVSLYYLPNLPHEPRPDLGYIYPIRNHYTVIYWTGTQLCADRCLSTAAISLYCATFLMLWRIRLLPWRK
jgi:hypothetical protein